MESERLGNYRQFGVRMKTNGNGNGHDNGNGNGNGSSPGPKFTLASSMNRADYRSFRPTFLEELQSQIANPPFDYKDKSNISWIQILNFPDRIVQTLKRLNTQTIGSKSAGFQSAIRCAISMGLPDIHKMPALKELKRLEVYFNHLPQMGEPRELFLGQFFSTRLTTEFSGKRYNIPVSDEMKQDIAGVSSAYSITQYDVVNLACHFALLRDGNEIPLRYRQEWTTALTDFNSFAAMKVQGAYHMIKTLPGSEDLVMIVPLGLWGLTGFDPGFSHDSHLELYRREEEEGDFEDWN